MVACPTTEQLPSAQHTDVMDGNFFAIQFSGASICACKPFKILLASTRVLLAF